MDQEEKQTEQSKNAQFFSSLYTIYKSIEFLLYFHFNACVLIWIPLMFIFNVEIEFVSLYVKIAKGFLIPVAATIVAYVTTDIIHTGKTFPNNYRILMGILYLFIYVATNIYIFSH